jgi:hypothetical protein
MGCAAPLVARLVLFSRRSAQKPTHESAMSSMSERHLVALDHMATSVEGSLRRIVARAPMEDAAIDAMREHIAPLPVAVVQRVVGNLLRASNGRRVQLVGDGGQPF